MKTTKKVLSILLAMLMAAGCFSLCSAAADDVVIFSVSLNYDADTIKLDPYYTPYQLDQLIENGISTDTEGLEMRRDTTGLGRISNGTFSWILKDATFFADVNYYIVAGLVPKGGYVFSESARVAVYAPIKKVSGLSVTVNGEVRTDVLIYGIPGGDRIEVLIPLGKPSPTVNVNLTAGAGGTVSGGGTFGYQEYVNAVAVPNSGYIFDGWYEGDEKISSVEDYGFQTIRSIDLTAKFKKASNTDPQPAPQNICPWCGGQHEGFFQSIIGWFHSLLASIFGAKY